VFSDSNLHWNYNFTGISNRISPIFRCFLKVGSIRQAKKILEFHCRFLEKQKLKNYRSDFSLEEYFVRDQKICVEIETSIKLK
jgi:hypothetical protein